MAKNKIMIVEDEEDIVEMIDYNLKKEGYSTVCVQNGEKAVSIIKREQPDLLLLDIMLPGINGLEVCKKVKNHDTTAHIPIIMLTAKSMETDKVVGLELGADDYMTKPFSPKELIARIRAVLRRYDKPLSSKKLKAGVIEIDNLKYKVLVAGKDITLSPTEFKILVFLVQRPEIVLSRKKILNGVFGYESEVYDRTVDAHIKALRRKLDKYRECIETVRGLGYRFKEI